MPQPLSKIERRILDYLIGYLQRHTYQPSVREIGAKFGIRSTKTVSEHLQSLHNKGLIRRDPSRSRGVKLLGLDLRAAPLATPQYGQVAAGPHGITPDGITDRFALDGRFGAAPGNFLLRVVGDSMIGAGIWPDDLVLVAPLDEEDVSDGEIIAARYQGEAVVKRFQRRDGRVVLESDNPAYPPEVVERAGSDFLVFGRVITLIRALVPVPALA